MATKAEIIAKPQAEPQAEQVFHPDAESVNAQIANHPDVQKSIEDEKIRKALENKAILEKAQREKEEAKAAKAACEARAEMEKRAAGIVHAEMLIKHADQENKIFHAWRAMWRDLESPKKAISRLVSIGTISQQRMFQFFLIRRGMSQDLLVETSDGSNVLILKDATFKTGDGAIRSFLFKQLGGRKAHHVKQIAELVSNWDAPCVKKRK